MTWVIRRILVLSAILSLLVTATIWLGSRLPYHSIIDFLHLTDCKLPCWIGIIPGKTTIREAREHVYLTYSKEIITELSGGLSVRIADNNVVFHVLFFEDMARNNPVRVIRLSVYDYKATYSDFIHLLGKPISISFPGRSVNVSPILIYPQQQIQVGFNDILPYALDCRGIRLDQAVNGLVIYDRMPTEYLLQEWRGFRPCYVP